MMLHESIEAFGLAHAGTYLVLFVAASLLMVWRLEALLDHGLEGTALGTLVMPYCSGFANLLFVALVVSGRGPVDEVLTNCLVNNVTNLTLLLGLPAVLWGLTLHGEAKTPRAGGKKKAAAAHTARQLNRLSLLLTLAAVLFFSGVTWALGSDGQLDRNDGLVLIGLFLFWQCFQVFDVLKHNARQRRSFGPRFYLDLLIVLASAYLIYLSTDWLMQWLAQRPAGFVSGQNLGWLSGWLMVLPNALLAFYYAARRRADIVYASQVGDGHICIPLCLGLAALHTPLTLSPLFDTGLVILLGAAGAHVLCVSFTGGLPRWMGGALLGAYAWFVSSGLFS